jgi:GTP-binding protein
MLAIAIIGRKNVGKSSIFNRLIGMRLSIVYKEPGVTRDRIYGDLNWCGRKVGIIDTGGFFPDEEDLLAGRIMNQIDLALKEADVIYFVVDGRAGLTPGDEEIAARLRKIDKKVFLLVNKIDSMKETQRALEFSRLGFSDVFPVSAEAGMGFGEMLDATVKHFPQERLTRDTRAIKILILGRPNAGKSTLLNTILKEERAVVDDRPGTTRDLVNARFEYGNKQIEIIDTYGLKKRSRVKEPIEFYSMMRVLKVIDMIDVAVLLFDVTQGVVSEDCHIAALVLSKAKGSVIAPNKIDLVGRKDLQRVMRSTRKSFEFMDFVPIVMISGKAGTGVDDLLKTVLNVYEENNKNADREVLKNMCGGLKPPPGGEILKVAQIGRRPPVFQAVVTVSVKDNYIKYLRRSIRSYFGFMGVPVLVKTRKVRG